MREVQTFDEEADSHHVEVGPREFALKDLQHLATPYGQHLCELAVFGLDLPYGALGGPGFERLCFHLLLSKGYQPRFFGRSGEAQFGIDLIVSDGARSSVYQCKNKANYTAADLSSDLDLFAKRWLINRPQLRRPQYFTLCSTARLDRRADWELVKQDFFNSYGVSVEEWHRDTLDTWLRPEPDIVADLFGDDVAERFCQREGWNDGLFRPVAPGSGEKDVERYLELKALGCLVHDSNTVAQFRQIVLGEGLILIEGLSGNGKTMAALDMTSCLGDGMWRVFYVNLRNGGDEQQLFEGIKARCVRPTLFILDDCHRDWTSIERVVSRAQYALKGRKFGLVLTAQTISDEAEPIGADVPSFLDDCRDRQLTLRITPTIDQYRRILRHRRPAFSSLSKISIGRLYAMTVQDLTVLDILLETLEDRALADVEVLSALFPGILRRYFGHEKVHAPNLKALAAIAQFDMVASLGSIPHPFEKPDNLAAVRRLTIKTGRPPSLTFVHASAAEVIFNALSWSDVDEDQITSAARLIVAHLLSFKSNCTFLRAFEGFLRGRLRLSNGSDIKQAVLADTNIAARLTELEGITLRFLGQATYLTRNLGHIVPYARLLAKYLEHIIKYPKTAKGEELALIGNALRSLSLADPIQHAALEFQLGGDPFLRLARMNGTILELFMFLKDSTPSFAAALIAALNAETVSELIDKTIAEERPIGTLNLALRELGKRELPQGGSQLTALEAHLSASAILRLIRANGTIFELFRFLQYSTPSFAAALIAALNPETVRELIKKTIAKGRSIATLNLTLRDLGKRELPQGGSQLAALEARLSSAAILRLIHANGTIFELFKFLEYSTPSFAAALIAALNAETVGDLIEKTIAKGRSIATLDLVLRDLGKRELPQGGSQLTALEAHLSAGAILRLIRANGTIFELFRFLQYSTVNFAAELIAALNAETMGELIDKTIAEERPIGTLNLALRELGKRELPQGGSQLAALEAHLSTAAILRLIRTNGTIFELFRFLQYNTPSFAAALITALNAEIVGELIDKTIAKGRSIGTLSFTLRELENRNLQSHLEEKISIGELWRLIQGVGDLNDLAYLIESLTPGFVGRLIAPDAAPGAVAWQELCRHGGFFEVARFIRDCIDKLPRDTRSRFEVAIAMTLDEIIKAAPWPNLSAGFSTAKQIKNISYRTKLEAAALAHLDRQDIDELAFADFMDAAAGLSCLWRREAFRSTLAARLWNLLPVERHWPGDHSFFLGGKLLLDIGISEHLSEADARRLLQSFSQLPKSKDIEKCSPAALYQFIVSLFALWRARRSSIEERFVDTQSSDFWVRVEGFVGDRAPKAGLNQDKLNVLALAGLLTLVLPGRTKRLAQALRGQIKGVSWLIEEAERLAFVPAALALRGLSLLDPYQARFSSGRRGLLLSKASEYDEQRPAVDFLCDWLRQDDRYHQPQRH